MKQITLSEDQQNRLVDHLKSLFASEFDETLSTFRAEQILTVMVKALGPEIYNLAVQDARAYFQSKLDDLEGEVYVSD